MKIVYCIVGTFNAGGMERVLANKANFMAEQGHELFIVTTDQQGRMPYFALDKRITLVDLGINYTNAANKGVLYKILTYPAKQLKHRQLLSAYLKKIHADLVISMFDHDASFLHHLKDNSKKILEIHFSRYKRLQYGRKGLLRFIDQFRSRTDLNTVKKYDRFVVLTEEDKGYWGSLPNVAVIPNANSFEPHFTSDLSAKRVIAVGRYDYQKGFDELIKAWTLVYQAHPDWSLVIFGQGPLKEDLQALINKLGLKDVVQLCAPVENIEKEYLHSSILALTSRYEGLPMALLEAQVCGLPLVSYTCKCGPRDVIRNGENGFLINEGDREALAVKLIQLMDHSALRLQMGRTSRMLSENYTEKVVMQRWMTLFQEILTIKT